MRGYFLVILVQALWQLKLIQAPENDLKDISRSLESLRTRILLNIYNPP